MNISDVNKLAIDINDKVRKSLLDNRKAQDRADVKDSEKDRIAQQTQTNSDVKKAKNTLPASPKAASPKPTSPTPGSPIIVSTTQLSTPEKDAALRALLIFDDKSKA